MVDDQAKQGQVIITTDRSSAKGVEVNVICQIMSRIATVSRTISSFTS